MGATCLMEIGFGMRAILCILPEIVPSWIQVFDALRTAGLISSTPSGDGSQKIAICPGSHFLFLPLLSL